MENRNSVIALIALNVIIFIVQNMVDGFTDAFALHDVMSNPFTLITSMFLHGSGFHLLSNMFALGLFGLILEQQIGTKKFLALYFASGVVSGIAASFFYDSALGASGAIFGVLGYLAVLQPRMTVWTYGVPMPMAAAAVFWLILDVAGVFYPSNVANMAHIAGLVLGVVLGLYSIRNRPRQQKPRKSHIVDDNQFENWEEKWM